MASSSQPLPSPNTRRVSWTQKIPQESYEKRSILVTANLFYRVASRNKTNLTMPKDEIVFWRTSPRNGLPCSTVNKVLLWPRLLMKIINSDLFSTLNQKWSNASLTPSIFLLMIINQFSNMKIQKTSPKTLTFPWRNEKALQETNLASMDLIF